MPDWFQVVEGRELEQGDILIGLVIVRPLHGEEPNSDGIIAIEQIEADFIVMTQSCDLVEGREKGARYSVMRSSVVD